QRCLPCRPTPSTRRPSKAWRTLRGARPPRTIGSGAHQTREILRPTATRPARTRAVSTSGSSGIGPWPPRLLHDLEQLHVEDQRGARLDLGRRSAVAVGDRRGTHQPGLAAHLHELDALRPAWNHLVQLEGGRLVALDRAVEDGAIGELARVMNLDLVGRL